MATDIDQQGASGAEDTPGASGAEDTPAVEPVISNSEAKKLPWVRDLMSKAAELDHIIKERAEAEARAERDKAEAEQDYKRALELETKRREELEAEYQGKMRQMQLDAEFVKAGLLDPRAIALFDSAFDPATQSAAEFVESIKADPANQMYFDTGRQRQRPPKAAGGQPDPFDAARDLDSWLRSSDPDKRARAIAHNREQYERQLHKG